jgi:hypothetical protein
MFYTCEICKKVFDQKSNYLNHLNRKNPCSLESKIKSENKIFECDQCGEKFTALSNLCRHKKQYCKGQIIKKSPAEIIANINPQILENYQNSEIGQKVQLEEIISDPNIIKIMGSITEKNKSLTPIQNNNSINSYNNIKNSNNTTNNNLNANVQNNTTNNNNIFIMAAFGKEGRIQVPKALLHSLYRNMENAIPRLVEYIHYNDNFPQFQNIEGKGISNSYVSIFDGSNWILQRKDEVVEKLIKDKKEILDDFFDGMVENNHSKLNSKIIKNYNEQSDKLDSVLNKDFYDIQPEKDAKALYKSIQTNVGLIMENQKIKKKAKKDVKKLD